jgi:hypothetical protein
MHERKSSTDPGRVGESAGRPFAGVRPRGVVHVVELTMRTSVLTIVAGLISVSTACTNDATNADDGTSSPTDGTSADGSTDGGSTDDGSTGAEPACPDGPSVGPWYLRRLTGEQLDNTVRDLLGTDRRPSESLPPDEAVGPFASNVTAPVTNAMVEDFMDVAEELAAEAVTDLDALLPCDPDDIGEDACASAFVETFGRRAYRRPLTDDEQAALFDLYQAGRDEAGFTAGIRLVVQAALQSPYFLYHAEFGELDEGDAVALTQYELAGRLSYFLWNTMPDDELFAAAEAGVLGDREGLRAEAERMIVDGRARDAIASFHLQWLGIADIESAEKDTDAYPEFTPALRRAMKAETATFTDYVIRYTDGTLGTLLTAPYSFPDGGVFGIYGVQEPVGGDDTTPVGLDPSQRAGLLTQPSVLAVHAHAAQSSPIRRGVLLRENLLCQMLPEPPPDVDNTPPDLDPDATTRERFEQHRADPACAACHELIDPIGFGFEHYDAVGRYRDVENDNPIDGSGALGGTDVDGSFDGAVELAYRLAESDDVRSCVAAQWFRFAFGRIETEADACSRAAIDDAFADSGYRIPDLMLAIVTSDAFRYRAATPSEGRTQEVLR